MSIAANLEQMGVKILTQAPSGHVEIWGLVEGQNQECET